MERKGFLLEEGAKYFIRLFFKKKKNRFSEGREGDRFVFILEVVANLQSCT